MTEDVVKVLSRPGSAIILVFLYPSAGTKFQGKLFQRGRMHNTRGMKYLRFSTEIPVFLGNGTR